MHSALLSQAYLAKACRTQSSVFSYPGSKNYSFPKCDKMLIS